MLGRERDRLRDPLEHRLARDAERLELAVGDRRLDHGRGHPELDECLDIRGDRAREAPDLGFQASRGDELDRAPVVLGDAREAGLDPVDAELVEEACDLELLLGIKHDADGLLAVAQGGVVEPDPPADAMRVVERAGPDQVLHRTTPSGKADSFSAPSAVIRKLSSSRRPPPCGQ